MEFLKPFGKSGVLVFFFILLIFLHLAWSMLCELFFFGFFLIYTLYQRMNEFNIPQTGYSMLWLNSFGVKQQTHGVKQEKDRVTGGGRKVVVGKNYTADSMVWVEMAQLWLWGVNRNGKPNEMKWNPMTLTPTSTPIHMYLYYTHRSLWDTRQRRRQRLLWREWR